VPDEVPDGVPDEVPDGVPDEVPDGVPDEVLICGLAPAVPTPEPQADNPAANANISSKYKLDLITGMHSRAVLIDSLSMHTIPISNSTAAL
jgi:hypothetical protein